MNFLRIDLKFSVVALFLVGLVGCNVQETTPSMLATEGINQELISEVSAISDYQVQRIAFAEMLTNEEKTFFFKKRINEKLQNLSLTSQQRDHLNELLTNMTSDVYNPSSAAGKKGIEFVSAWTKEGKTIFEQGTLYDIVGSLEASKGDKSTNKTAPPPDKCNCATASDYCQDGYACTYIPSCYTPYCGTFLAYTCNGSCDKVL